MVDQQLQEQQQHEPQQPPLPPPLLSEWPDSGVVFDIRGHAAKVEELRLNLHEREARLKAGLEEQQLAQEALQEQQYDLDSLRTQLVASQTESQDHAQRFCEAQASVDFLMGEVQTEHVALAELERKTSEEHGRLRRQLHEKRTELQRMIEINEDLHTELEQREATGCFRKRAPATGSAGRPRSDAHKGGSPQQVGPPTLPP